MKAKGNYYRRKKIIIHSESNHRPFDGPCSQDSFRCWTTRKPNKATNRCCIVHNIRILRAVSSVLYDIGVPWWLDYGAHLGYMKNGGFYWNDKDTDVNCLTGDRAVVREAIAKLTETEGFHVYYKPPTPGVMYQHSDILKVRLSKTNHNDCDITFWDIKEGILTRNNWAKSDLYKGREVEVNRIFPTQRRIWEDFEVNIAAEPEWLVSYRYGNDWRDLPAVRYVPIERN